VGKIHLVRHGESASNAGLVTESAASNPITEVGRAQAERFAAAWSEPPQLIVTSSYIRTQMTAAPFLAKYTDVPHETWPVEEWTQLTPSKYRGTTNAERRPRVLAYYDRKDPHFRDGVGAESFAGLFSRVGRVLTQAANRKEETIVIFTHGHFMRAVLWSILVNPRPETPADMERFLLFSEVLGIQNLTMMTIRSYEHEWLVGRFWNLP
jgi:probable phosphoglycerate mutase